MKQGCYTALITPFNSADELDMEGLDQLIQFQIENDITGILAVGTTGESPTLHWEEHNKIVANIAKATKNRCICIAGAGSNNTKETLEAVKSAYDAGADAVLLVDPYYNGPSSLEIRKEYIEPVAQAFPEIEIIPYIIPGRTGTQLLPEDLGILSKKYKNVASVKEATGNIENMKQTRKCCGDDFSIFSGDDGLVFKMMTDNEIKAAGVISVVTNIAPKAVTDMVKFINDGNMIDAEKLHKALIPLLDLVTVTTEEKTPFGKVKCRARNPLPLKTLMQVLGMPSGKCRKPIGKMTKNGLDKVISIAQKIQKANPEIFAPMANFFNIDIEERLNSSDAKKGLWYDY